MPPPPGRSIRARCQTHPGRRRPGSTATPYRRDKLDDLIALQVGPARHTITHAPMRGEDTTALPAQTGQSPLDIELHEPMRQPVPELRVHPTQYCYAGDADPSAAAGIAAISVLAPRHAPGPTVSAWPISTCPLTCSDRSQGEHSAAAQLAAQIEAIRDAGNDLRRRKPMVQVN